jgi:hypothetical protein
MTSQSIHQSGCFSGFTSISANPEQHSRLFAQSRVLPMSSLPSESQHSKNKPERYQAQTERQPADSDAPAGTARNPTAISSDPVVTTKSDNEE